VYRFVSGIKIQIHHYHTISRSKKQARFDIFFLFFESFFANLGKRDGKILTKRFLYDKI
jgi:hypothetical protein